jgi:hypothetical protein
VRRAGSPSDGHPLLDHAPEMQVRFLSGSDLRISKKPPTLKQQYRSSGDGNSLYVYQ